MAPARDRARYITDARLSSNIRAGERASGSGALRASLGFSMLVSTEIVLPRAAHRPVVFNDATESCHPDGFCPLDVSLFLRGRLAPDRSRHLGRVVIAPVVLCFVSVTGYPSQL